MTPAAVIFTVLTALYLLKSSRDWAPLPLLIGASYMTLGQEVLIGPFHFSVLRILIAVGFIRVMLKGEKIVGGWKSLDSIMMLWGIWAIASSAFHKDFSSALISHLGLTYDCLGLYFLLRVFVQDLEGVSKMAKVLIILLTPVALEMIVEHWQGKNAFAAFGGVPEESEIRGGRIRAQGPFGHSILAGTVGAVCWPMALVLWRQNRRLALTGLIVTFSIVWASSSSGPIMTSLIILFGLCLWPARGQTRLIRIAALGAILLLNLLMNAPVYYLISKIDLTGNSTGWHRAALIEAAINHFNEWWLGGTDYTRHWMPTGVPWTQDHTDITNHYIKMGVIGGFPLMLLFIGGLWSAFAAIGRALAVNTDMSSEQQFRIWILGAILFGHAATFLSVSYFDQTIIFVYMTLAIIGSLSTASVLKSIDESEPSQPSEERPPLMADMLP